MQALAAVIGAVVKGGDEASWGPEVRARLLNGQQDCNWQP